MRANQFCVLTTTTESRAKIQFQYNEFTPQVAYAVVCSKAVVLLLLIYGLMYFPLFVGGQCLSSFCYELLCAHSSFAII